MSVRVITNQSESVRVDFAQSMRKLTLREGLGREGAELDPNLGLSNDLGGETSTI